MIRYAGSRFFDRKQKTRYKNHRLNSTSMISHLWYDMIWYDKIKIWYDMIWWQKHESLKQFQSDSRLQLAHYSYLWFWLVFWLVRILLLAPPLAVSYPSSVDLWFLFCLIYELWYKSEREEWEESESGEEEKASGSLKLAQYTIRKGRREPADIIGCSVLALVTETMTKMQP